MSFEETFAIVSKLEGWMGESDCRALWNQVKDLKKATIVEIGSYGGISTIVLANASPTSHVIAIDPYIGYEDVYKNYLKAIEGLNIKHIKEKAEDALIKVKIDFLHIDGDHSYEFVVKDIKKYVPMVKKGGYVFFHDYPVHEFGVGRAVDEFKDIYFDRLDMASGFARGRVK
jgi:predicted O-methyltransferase YrrM